MGYATTTYLTAVGDTVHVAARLEALTKDYACELVLSEEVAVRAGLDVSDHARHELTVRNREAPLAIFVAPSAGRLAERLRARARVSRHGQGGGHRRGRARRSPRSRSRRARSCTWGAPAPSARSPGATPATRSSRSCPTRRTSAAGRSC